MNPQTIVDWLLGLGPEMLLFVVLIGLGYTLKNIPLVDNKWIPLVNLLVAIIVYPLLCQPGKAPPHFRYPIVYFVLIGFVIFVLSWLLHNKVLKQVEEKLGLFDKPDVPPPTTHKTKENP